MIMLHLIWISIRVSSKEALVAEGLRFVCSSCGHAIEAWSDGNPYFLDKRGQKQYAYHPDHENLSRCIGNDSPHLCLTCGEEFLVDSQDPIIACPQCASSEIVRTFALDGKNCPYCRKGSFIQDQDSHMIS